MRDVNRIKPLIMHLKILWLQNPDMRFGQLVENISCGVGGNSYYAEDDEWFDVIQRYIENHNKGDE